MTSMRLFFLNVVLIITACGYDHSNYDGASTISSVPFNPVVMPQTKPKRLAVGGNSSAYLRDDGTAVLWGKRTCLTDENEDLVALSERFWSGPLALKADGTVVTGSCYDGDRAEIPSWLTNVVAISRSYRHSLALTADGDVLAWGGGNDRVLTVPDTVKNIVAISAGADFSLALDADGRVHAWGIPDRYTSDNREFSRTAVPAHLGKVVAISAGRDHSLALLADGRVAAWGDNFHGKSTVPEGLTDEFGAIAVAAGDNHNLVLLANGSVRAWGTKGQPHVLDVPSGLGNIVEIAAGSSHNLAIEEDGSLHAWGSNGSSQSTLPADLSGAQSATTDLSHILLYNGEVIALDGYPLNSDNEIVEIYGGGAFFAGIVDQYGLLNFYPIYNTGQLPIFPIDYDVSTLKNVDSVSLMGDNIVALKIDGKVHVWSPNPEDKDIAESLTDIRAVAAGDHHFLAIESDGTVTAWGESANAETLDVPLNLENVQSVTVGRSIYSDNSDDNIDATNYALTTDGTVISWPQSKYSAYVESLTDVTQISGHMALLKSGEVVSLVASNDLPQGLNGIMKIRGHGVGGIAFKEDGRIISWGEIVFPEELYDLP